MTPFDAIQSGAALNPRQCDLAASAMTITEERAENLAFSDPYFDADQSLMIRADDAGAYGALDDLAGQRIGVQASTTGAIYANENAPEDAEVVDYPDSSALFQALQGNEIAAVLQDFPVNAFFASQNDTVEIVEQYPTGEQYGLAAQRDNTALIDAVNEELDTLQSDGTYDRIYEEWFGTAPSSASEGASAAPCVRERHGVTSMAGDPSGSAPGRTRHADLRLPDRPTVPPSSMAAGDANAHDGSASACTRCSSPPSCCWAWRSTGTRSPPTSSSPRWRPRCSPRCCGRRRATP